MLFADGEKAEDDEEIHNSIYAEQEAEENREKMRQKALNKIKKLKEKPVSSEEVVDFFKAGKKLIGMKSQQHDMSEEQRDQIELENRLEKEHIKRIKKQLKK